LKAVYYEAFGGEINMANVADPSPVDHGVVLKVTATGVCRSDWHGWQGHDPDIKLPHIPGHELAGEIIAVGPEVHKFKIGERVTVPFVGGCGHCEYCDQGDHQVCPNQFQPGFTHWGSFAEYVSIQYADTNLVRLPAEIDDVTAACLGCRFATSYRALIDQAGIQSDKTIAVFGCGGVGLSAIMIAKAKGLQVVAVDIDERKLNYARKHGADIIINSKNHSNFIEEFLDKSRGGADYSIDAIGNQQVIMDAIEILKRRGKHIQVGLLHPDQYLTPVAMNRIIAYELELKGSHGMQAHRYNELMELITSGKLDPKSLVTKQLSLEESIAAIRSMNNSAIEGIQVVTEF